MLKLVILSCWAVQSEFGFNDNGSNEREGEGERGERPCMLGTHEIYACRCFMFDAIIWQR